MRGSERGENWPARLLLVCCGALDRGRTDSERNPAAGNFLLAGACGSALTGRLRAVTPTTVGGLMSRAQNCVINGRLIR